MKNRHCAMRVRTAGAIAAALILCAGNAQAAAAATLSATSAWIGPAALVLFVLAYALVVGEERLHLQKSKPVVVAAALIWGLIAVYAQAALPAQPQFVAEAFRHIFLEFAELFFFLLVAMSYVSAIAERHVFEAMRGHLVARGFGYRSLFWLTGAMAFCLSAVLDNLTTALVMAGVILAIGAGNRRFITVSFVNLIVAANAGGAWCAFGDITTLMVWQSGKAGFFDFFRLFLPAVVTWLVPALVMHWAVPLGKPPATSTAVPVKIGGLVMCGLLGVTIAMTVAGRQLWGLPPVWGMMAGLGLLKLFAFWLAKKDQACAEAGTPYSIFRIMATAQWDTLLFFYGILLCVGGLATIGYLDLASAALYTPGNTLWANVAMGLLSAIVDNIPIMYAVLRMDPAMGLGQWLLITLTTGVGGSLLSVGSAAGVALMGQSRGLYTFGSHLRWSWAVALGYAAGIATHLWVNRDLFP